MSSREEAPGSVRTLVAVATSVFVATITWFVFARALDAEFVDWDDPLNITQNHGFRGFGGDYLRWMFTTFTAGHYIPVTWLSLALDHEFFGLESRAFHRTNVLLHALNAVLVLAIARTLFTARLPRVSPGLREASAVFAALLFALHPLRVESVAWATERRDVLSSALLFASFLVWLRAVTKPGGEPSALPRRASIGLYALSLLSKSMGLTLPAVLLCVDFWLARHRTLGLRRILVEKLPYLVLAGLAAGVSLYAQAAGTEKLATFDEFTLGKRAALTVYSLAFYPWKTLWPANLSPLYELDPGAAALSARLYWSALGVLAALLLAWFTRRRRPAIACGLAVYAIILSPLSGLVQTGIQETADRFSYQATLSLALLCGAGLAVLCLARPKLLAPGILLAAGASGTCAFLTVRQLEVWQNSEALWSRAVAVDPKARVPRLQLAITLHQRQDFAGALEHYDRLAAGITEAQTAGAADVHYNRALSLLALNRHAEARADLERALQSDPTHRATLRVLGDFEPREGKLAEHLARWQRAFDLAPANAALRVDGAAVLVRAGRVEDALGELARARELDPGYAPAFYAAGVVELPRDLAQAELLLARAVELDPFRAGHWTRWGVALERSGRNVEARDAWKRALEIDPDYAPAREALDGP